MLTGCNKIKNCKYCGKEFVSSGTYRVYCSPECARDRRIYKRTAKRLDVIDLDGELWVSPDKYTGYAFSSCGRVKALAKTWVTGKYKMNVTKKEHLLTSSLNIHGYYHVIMRIDGKSVTKRLHRIIAEIFIPNPENKPEVNHIDGNKINNNINNLEWVTRKENVIHSWICEGIKRKPHKKGIELTDEEKEFIRNEYEGGLSIRKIAIKMDRDYSTVWAFIGKYVKENKFVVSINGWPLKEVKALYNKNFSLPQNHKVSKEDLDIWMGCIIENSLQKLKKIN